jgi:hypothetical protein
MLKTLAPIFMAVLLAGLSGCAPRSVPFGASVHLSLKGGFYWTWTRTFEHGCVAWMAKDDYASVDLLIDGQCDAPRAWVDVGGAGINYFSSSDEIVFRGYWPMGEMHGGNPCAHRISEAQIAELRRVVAEALAEARTQGERRVLNRIDERLSVVNGDALMTYHGGWCSDLTQADWTAGTARQSQETWRDSWQDGR